jgi:hypothetical protein
MMAAKRFENMISTLSSETVVSVVFLLATAWNKVGLF